MSVAPDSVEQAATPQHDICTRDIDATECYFNRAADELELNENVRKLLTTAKREVQVQIPIERDDGQLATYIGYRVQHDNARGPMKGGLRYHHEVDLDEVRDLVDGTFLEDAPLVRTAATKGRGLDELRGALLDACRSVAERPRGELFRMAIDRAFVVQGHGNKQNFRWIGNLH